MAAVFNTVRVPLIALPPLRYGGQQFEKQGPAAWCGRKGPAFSRIEDAMAGQSLQRYGRSCLPGAEGMCASARGGVSDTVGLALRLLVRGVRPAPARGLMSYNGWSMLGVSRSCFAGLEGEQTSLDLGLNAGLNTSAETRIPSESWARKTQHRGFGGRRYRSLRGFSLGRPRFGACDLHSRPDMKTGDPEGIRGPQELSDHVTRLCRTRAVLWVAEAA